MTEVVGDRQGDILKVGIARIAPVWQSRAATLAKIEQYVEADSACTAPW